MAQDEKNPAAVALGQKGGIARAKSLTAKRRKEIALKAAEAASKVHKRKAKARKKQAGKVEP